MKPQRLSRPELWGGLECTVNRVGDQYFDQVERSGHGHRLADLDLFADLGIRALRYPILWERTAPDGPGQFRWTWADERLGRLRELGLRPIVGLLHHGSGPRYTDLLDPLFPEKLAAFAAAVAERYPWVDSYTPVNEPLTTARFSALYGHWYPHRRDNASFVRALLAQCRGTVLAMQAIRGVNPAARLIQTDDLGTTLSTPRLAYQAEFENHRRWLGWDLLCGRVGADHPLRADLLGWGASEAELDFFQESSVRPDVVGINHYITSNRFLDQRFGRYPPHTRGGNAFHRYADVEAVRVASAPAPGVGALLREAAERFGVPVALTEVHLGCTRGEQLRWFADCWHAAVAAAEQGVEVHAVTAWSLLGSFDWSTLLTRPEGTYEPGAFDVRSPLPRPTALAHLLRQISTGGEVGHPVLKRPGWWERGERFLYPPAKPAQQRIERIRRSSADLEARPILITGANGTLGTAFVRICGARGLAAQAATRQEMDIADAAAVERMMAAVRPWAVINAAGYVRVDDAEREPEVCFRENTHGAEVLASACALFGSRFVAFSSDLVFGGGQQRPYIESDAPEPLGIYGQSKAEGEARVMEVHPSALIVRSSPFFSPWDTHDFVGRAVATLAAGSIVSAPEDAIVSATYLPDLVNATLDLLIDGEVGFWHIANGGACSWADLARTAAHLFSVDPAGVVGISRNDWRSKAKRPRFSALTSERGILLPSLDDALGRYAAEGLVSRTG